MIRARPNLAAVRAAAASSGEIRCASRPQAFAQPAFRLRSAQRSGVVATSMLPTGKKARLTGKTERTTQLDALAGQSAHETRRVELEQQILCIMRESG